MEDTLKDLLGQIYSDLGTETASTIKSKILDICVHSDYITDYAKYALELMTHLDDNKPDLAKTTIKNWLDDLEDRAKDVEIECIDGLVNRILRWLGVI